jgi:hypothetical protein
MKDIIYFTLSVILALAASGSEVRAQKNNSSILVQPAFIFGKPGTGEGSSGVLRGSGWFPGEGSWLPLKVIIGFAFLRRRKIPGSFRIYGDWPRGVQPMHRYNPSSYQTTGPGKGWVIFTRPIKSF